MGGDIAVPLVIDIYNVLLLSVGTPLWQRFNLFGVFVKSHDVVGLLL